MVKRPLEEEDGQNLESICRAVKRLQTSPGSLANQASGSTAPDAAPDQLAGMHPGALQTQRQQQLLPAADGSEMLSPSGRPHLRVVRPSWGGAGAAAALQPMAAQQPALHAGYGGGAAIAPADAVAAAAATAAAGFQDPLLQRQQGEPTTALEQQLAQQKAVHEQQYLARQQQQQALEARQQIQQQLQQQGLGGAEAQQQMQQMQQQHVQQQLQQGGGGGGADFAGPSTPRQAEEQTPAALLARERAAYDASNVMLKELHFERLRRLTLSDDGDTGRRWQRQ